MHREAAAAALTAGWILLSCLILTAHHSVASNFDQGKTLDVEEATYEKFIPEKK